MRMTREELRDWFTDWMDDYYDFLEDDLTPEVAESVLVALSTPTLTPPNEPLTLDDLREMDAPVWCSCKPIEGGNGYWCLCRYGYITTPGRTFFEVGEIPHWVFYRRPPEEECE